MRESSNSTEHLRFERDNERSNDECVRWTVISKQTGDTVGIVEGHGTDVIYRPRASEDVPAALHGEVADFLGTLHLAGGTKQADKEVPLPGSRRE